MAVNALAGLAREAASSPFMRGLTALPYRLAGGPVDLADMVVRPIANAAGIPIAEPQDMYGTSDWMIKQAIDAGLLMPRTDTGAEMAGDFLGQLAAPGVGPGEAMLASSIVAIPKNSLRYLSDPIHAPATLDEILTSRVVDEFGAPLDVFHGTNRPSIDRFRTDVAKEWAPDEIGGFFTTSRRNAGSYGENVIRSNLILKNPMEVSASDWDAGLAMRPRQAKEAGFDGYVIRGQDGGDTYVAFYPEQIRRAKED